MSNWIFVTMTGYKEFKRRIDERMWPIYKNTSNKNKLRVGDNLVFYLGGYDGQKFLGSARIGSDLAASGNLDYYVGLSNIDVWKNPVSIKDILTNLKFISNKVRWGIHLQGGVIHLPDDDFNTILHDTKHRT